MVELLKKVVRKFFKTSKPETVYPILKTRAQLISEGKGTYVTKREIHGTTRFR